MFYFCTTKDYEENFDHEIHQDNNEQEPNISEDPADTIQYIQQMNLIYLKDLSQQIYYV